MSASGGTVAVWALAVMAGWATVALSVTAVVAVLNARLRVSNSRPGRGAYGVRCPACEAAPRRACHRRDGAVMASPHVIRTGAAFGFIEPGEDGGW